VSPGRETSSITGDGRLLEAVLDAAASLIVVAFLDGTLIRWNRACEELLGYTAAELERPSGVFDLMPVAERPVLEDMLRELRAGESPVRGEIHWRTRDGELRLIAWSVAALTGSDGEPTHAVATGIDVTDARHAEDRLKHMADHDGLTGLCNRRRFEEELERHSAYGRRYGVDGALLMLDLDGFKAVNDGYGHRAGDSVLAAVAGVLKNRLRETDVLARFGGDEFAVLMPHGGDAEAAELSDVLVNAVRAEVSTPAGPIDASAGYAVFDNDASADEMLSRADDAMYAQKAIARQQGRRRA
jgi:diguanylate cyclase (GGDEF)-like protein/PAS domain S-box-containing protein